MRKLANFSFILVIIGFVYLAFPQKAHAYIDPGTGSMIIQILIAGFLAASFAVKAYGKKNKGFYRLTVFKGIGRWGR